MKITSFRFEYKFKINTYTSDISIIHAEYSAPMRSKKSYISLMLPSKIGSDKMKMIVKMHCEKQLEMTSDQIDFIKKRIVKTPDPSVFDFKTDAEFDRLFEAAKKQREEAGLVVPSWEKYRTDYDKLIQNGVSEQGAKKIISVSAEGQDVLEMNNALYCEGINKSPKLIEKFVRAGLGMYAQSIAKNIKLNRGV